MNEYKVEYLQHSILNDCEQVSKVISQDELVKLLANKGMVTVISGTLVQK